MKKRYINPDVSMDSFVNYASLLADSSIIDASSSVEGFIDDGDMITW